MLIWLCSRLLDLITLDFFTMGDAWEFEVWGTEYELSQTTKDVLVAKGFSSCRTMRKLDTASTKSLFDTKITPGQMLMLQEGVEVINPPQAPEESTDGVDTRRAPRENQDQDTDPQPGTSRDARMNKVSLHPPEMSFRDRIQQGGSVSADRALELLSGKPAVAQPWQPPTTEVRLT